MGLSLEHFGEQPERPATQPLVATQFVTLAPAQQTVGRLFHGAAPHSLDLVSGVVIDWNFVGFDLPQYFKCIGCFRLLHCKRTPLPKV